MTTHTDNQPPTLIVSNFLSRTLGNRAVCEDLAENLRSRGWPVLTTSARAAPVARVGEMVSTAIAARRRYRVAQVDVFSGAAFLWAEAACSALRVARRPFVLSLHGGNLPAFAGRYPDRVGRLLRSAQAVTAPSPYLRDSLRPFRGDIILLPNALDLSAFAFRLRRCPKPRLMWLRAFHRKYNPSLAVRVLASLTDEFPDTTLTMIGPDRGDGSLEETLRLAAELGVAARLHLPGAVSRPQLARQLANGDIFLNTTAYESFGVSVMEAAALGLCVVSTNVGALPSIWTHGCDALLVPPNDVAAMARAVRRILIDPSVAAGLSGLGRQRAERCDRSLVMPRWETLLRSLATTAS